MSVESQRAVSPFEAVPSPESQGVVVSPGLLPSPHGDSSSLLHAEGAEFSSLEGQGGVVSVPVQSQGAMSSSIRDQSQILLPHCATV